MKLAFKLHPLGILLFALCIHAHAQAVPKPLSTPLDAMSEDKKSIERGRYLVSIAGCNDCHTPNYPQSGGQVPEKQWLIGDQTGWRGPWGTTYAVNLRKYMHNISEEEWIKVAHTRQMRPPMPWFALRDMSKEDLTAIYRFVRYLGPDNNVVPTYVGPNQNPTGPVIQFPMPPK